MLFFIFLLVEKFPRCRSRGTVPKFRPRRKNFVQASSRIACASFWHAKSRRKSNSSMKKRSRKRFVACIVGFCPFISSTLFFPRFFAAQKLLSLRSQDRKANARVQAMLKRTKAANKGVLDDPKISQNTAVTAASKNIPSILFSAIWTAVHSAVVLC